MWKIVFIALIAASHIGMSTAWVSAQQVPTDPASTHIFPAGGRRGSVVSARIGGECFSPYSRFVVFGNGITAEPELIEKVTGKYEPSPRRKPGESPMNYPREWKSTLTIEPNAEIGQAFWRVSSARGGVSARPFLIGDLPEFIETESNSSPESAEPISLPVTVNGQIAGERDLDYFRFTARKDDVVSIDLAVARIGSPLEPVIEVCDERGHRLTIEEIRVGSDPVFAVRIPSTAEYRLMISNLKFRGGPQYVYRLTISTAPYVKYAFPPAGVAGTTSKIRFFALSGDRSEQSWIETVSFPEPSQEFDYAGTTTLANSVRLESTDRSIVVESEPNDDATTATAVEVGANVYGRSSGTDDVDIFSCELKKDSSITLECRSFPRGMGLLPSIAIHTADRRLLASVNSAERWPRIGRIEWRVPDDGTYFFHVRDVRIGNVEEGDVPYRLTIRPTVPDFSVTASADVVNVVQGSRGELELKIERQGNFALPIDLTVEGLPQGVRVEPVQIPAGQDLFRIALIADADIPTSDSRLIIHATAKDGDRLISQTISALHSGHDAEGVSLGSPVVDHVQLTIRHKPVFRLFCNEAYQYAYRGTVYPYLMEVERMDGFDGPIQLEVADRQIKDLDGVEVLNAQIPAGKSQFMLPLFLPEDMHINVQAHSNVYAQGFVVFQDKWGRRQSMTQISEMRCMIRPLPTVAKLRVHEKQIEWSSGKMNCTFQLDRTSNFNGEMRVELDSPPPGISMESVVIPAGETAATATVIMGNDTDVTDLHRLTFRGRGDLPGGVQVISDAVLPNGH